MSNTPIYSDFWLSRETYSDYIDPTSETPDTAFSIDLIKLASTRRIISNYVDILTGTSIPVYFKAAGDSYNIGGKEIYITTEIRRRKDFDQAVGLALHEAGHTLLTDFDLAKGIPWKAPKSIWEFGKKYNIRKLTMERFLHTMFNIVEDWYIDDWVISRVPGYVGYYEASYNVCFNTMEIDQLLMGNKFRFPSLASYEFRIINFTNPLTDLNALPGLEEIAKLIDISNISRLTTTAKRITIAYKVVNLVLKNLKEYHDDAANAPQPATSGKKSNRINVDQFFKDSKSETSSSTGESSDASDSSSQKPKSDVDRTVEDIANALAQRPLAEEDENKEMTSKISKSFDAELPKNLKKAVEQQIQYLRGYSEKAEINQDQKTMLDLIEKHGISLVYVPVAIQGNDAAFRVGCIVVRKMTMELIESGQELFPMGNFWKDIDGDLQPDLKTAEAVKKGMELGAKLGRRLVLRRESNVGRNIRKQNGKINRRLLYSAGFNAEDIFEKIKINKFNKGSLHITVDASTSMIGEKWLNTMTMCVAICKATSMVDNIHVTVSFRATKRSKDIEMPYIVQAYDSKVDKISKVKKLFRYLCPCGCTPEGLAFGAIMGLFTDAVPDEEDRYFLNISDGEPFFQMKSPMTGNTFTYSDGNGVEHTKNQVNKIRRQGICILSYYIDDKVSAGLGFTSDHDTKKNFQMMYGKDARFIKPNSVIELAKTINELFLKAQ